MDIRDASTYFDDDPVYDAYTGAFLWNAQVSSFDDSHSDGATNRRRVLSLGPDLAMPSRRVIDLYGDKWVVGTGTPDGWKGEVVRQHFTMKRVTDLMSLLTPNQLLTGAAGTKAYAHKFYFKDGIDALDSSEIDTFWNIFIAPSEPAVKGWMFKDASGRVYRVRNDYLPVEGLRVCQSDAMDVGAVTTALWDLGTYDPINDSVSGGTLSISVLMVETPKFYRFRYASDPALAKGDMTFFVPATVTPRQADTFTTTDGVQWRVMTVQAEMDAWAILARRS